jgi:hypothetical protein
MRAMVRVSGYWDKQIVWNAFASVSPFEPNNEPR